MTFPPKMLIPNQEMPQEQSDKEIAPTKESAQKGQRPIESFRADCSKWLHSSLFSASEDAYSILRLAEWPRAGESTCKPRFQFLKKISHFMRWASMAMVVVFCECLEQKWAVSAICRNRQAHITNGNQYCQQCGLFLGTWYFTNLPTKFRSWPVFLPNGMMVHQWYDGSPFPNL